MKIKKLHPWNVSAKEAVEIQKSLQGLVVLKDNLREVKFVAGIDAGFTGSEKYTRAAVVVLEYPTLGLIEAVTSEAPTSFPYIPGLLSFRELPAVLAALKKIKQIPDLLLCDGQGYAHPRRFGIACHLGVLTDIPAIGVGKTRLLGSHTQVADKRGSWQPLIDNKEVIGAVLRTREKVKPIYISPGHRISLDKAVSYVMACTGKYKLPETTRIAHKFASNL